MKKLFYLFGILSLLFISACDQFTGPDEEQPQPLKGDINITGQVMTNNQPVQDALVTVSNVVNWSARTDANGNFTIKNIIKGEHQIVVVKEYSSGNKSVHQTKIGLNDTEINVGVINLPQPVTLNALDVSAVNNSEIKVSWKSTAASNFIEYRVIKNYTAVLDEKNGIPVFSSSKKSDTVCIDNNFRTGRTVYYRLLAYSSAEAFSMSNIERADIPEINIVDNGSFESSADGVRADAWLYNITGDPLFNYFELSNQNTNEGSRSLMVSYVDSLKNSPASEPSWGGIRQVVSTSNLKQGEEYELSFWSMSETGSIHVRLLKNGDESNPVISYVIPHAQSWRQHKFPFKLDESTSYYEVWINTKTALAHNGYVRGWVDDVKIIK